MRLVKYWFLEESFNMFKRIGMKGMMELCEVLVMKSYKKGDRIQNQSDDDQMIYFIKKGHVKIGVEKDDEFIIKQVLSKGNIFGENKVLTEESSEPYVATAMSDTIICFINHDEMANMIGKFPKLHNSIFKLAGLKFKKIERRLDDIIYKDAETRITDFILDFAKENGTEDEGDLIAPNIFSHSDIAKLTSTSRQTVNNTISNLRKKEVIAYDRKNIIVKKNGQNH